ncbi:MAG: alpha/beta fold hydrolase [Janthinobacterium lividum]
MKPAPRTGGRFVRPRSAQRRRRAELQPLVGEPVEVETDDGVRLHVEVDPADGRAGHDAPTPTIVFCHGYALMADTWHFQRLALRGRYRLVLPEHRGHGRSERGPLGPTSIARLADDLGEVLDAVVPSGPIVLVGHSLGGMTIMELSVRRPDLLPRIAAVALVTTSAGGMAAVDHGLPLLGHHLVRWAELALERAAGRTATIERSRRAAADIEQRLVRHWSFAGPVAPELVSLAARMMADTPVDVIADLLPAFGTLDEREALASLAGRPVLVLAADRDLMTPAAHAREIADGIPDAEHVLVRGAAHLVMLEHPTIVTARLERLLARIGNEGAAHPDEVVVPLPDRSRRRR